jgi:hypothetical protein
MTAPRKSNAPLPTRKQAQERYAFLDGVARRYRGPLEVLEAALGMYVIGHHFGWKVLHMVHSRRTVARYEAILGIKVRDVFAPIGPDAERANAYAAIQGVANFWKAVSGDEKVAMDRPTRRSVR